MLAKYDSKFDSLITELHAIQVQQTIMRHLIEDCTEQDFLDYFTDRIHYFRAGQQARAYFDECYSDYKRMIELGIRKVA